MTMRVAIGGIWHETNTFASTVTTERDFRRYQLAEGEGLRAYAGVRNEIGGFLAAAADAAHGFEVVPTLFAAAVPSGLVERAAYDALKGRLLGRLVDAAADGGPVDAVLLALHGAMVVAGIEDPEADLVAAVRAVVGDVPVVATLDFHANVSLELFESTDALLGYDTYPHVDPYDRAVEAGRLVAAMVERAARPAKSFRKLALVTPPLAQETSVSPMADVTAEMWRREAADGMACITTSPGFAYADVARLGFSVAAYAWSGQAAADEAADAVAQAAWDRRYLFTVDHLDPADAVVQAMAEAAGPVVLVDVADNIGGGSPGDGTVLLAELLTRRAQGAVVVVADPEAVTAALAAGVGATVDLMVGGKIDRRHGDPVPMRATVCSVSAGEYVHSGSYMTGQHVSMGRTAVVRSGGVEVVLTERATMPFDTEQLRSQGIQPEACRIIVAKAAIAWRAAYGQMAVRAIAVNTPGVCTNDLSELGYRNAPVDMVLAPVPA
ncbi:MAG: hypothetical protein QOI20_2536 [Acidimicrobiaceae bacterium]|jgi:microcystin degradation protein MlrC|nr:hypothetical protein [Acidimicrobiaceae bacterium]